MNRQQYAYEAGNARENETEALRYLQIEFNKIPESDRTIANLFKIADRLAKECDAGASLREDRALFDSLARCKSDYLLKAIVVEGLSAIGHDLESAVSVTASDPIVHATLKQQSHSVQVANLHIGCLDWNPLKLAAQLIQILRHLKPIENSFSVIASAVQQLDLLISLLRHALQKDLVLVL